MTCEDCSTKWVAHCAYCRASLCRYHLHHTPHGLHICASCDDGK